MLFPTVRVWMLAYIPISRFDRFLGLQKDVHLLYDHLIQCVQFLVSIPFGVYKLGRWWRSRHIEKSNTYIYMLPLETQSCCVD
jgi:hypothetical protein